MSDHIKFSETLSPEELRSFEETIARFEQAWHQKGQPNLDDFLPDEGLLRTKLLEELVSIDIEFRQRRGESVDTAEYQKRFSEQKAKDVLSGNQSTVSLTQETVAWRQTDAQKVEETDIPATFGRYRIVKALGQGAMGAVYLAHDQQLDRQVALKIPKFTGAEAKELLARFYREARLAAALRHPNICPVFDVGEIDGRHYITMAFIEGRSLKEFVASKRVQPLRQIAIVVRKLAIALEEAHAQGVIHRDLKPANIMIDAKGEPVVMDFGLARRASNEEAQVTHSGAILGTPAYMSPEQVEGDQKKIGPAADVYSLGVILYELLTGQRPFQGSVMSILQQIGIGQPKPPSQLRLDIDPVLEGICLKMMSRQQADRYPSMKMVAQSLTEYLKSSSGQTSQTGSLATSSLSPGLLAPAKQASHTDVDAATVMFSGGQADVAAASVAPATEGSSAAKPVSEANQSTDKPAVVKSGVKNRKVTRSVSESVSHAGAKSPLAHAVGYSATGSGKQPIPRWPSRNWLVAGASLAGIVLMFAVTLFFRVGNVDVKVVIDDPSLAVKFDKQLVTFEGSGTPIRLKPGEHKFIVERDGLEAETDHFVVKKDGKNVLRVSVVDDHVVVNKDDKPSLKNNPTLVETKPNANEKQVRDEVANTLRQIGATVQYGTGEDASRVKSISLSGEGVEKHLSDTDVASIAAFGDSLETLRISTIATDKRLAVLEKLPNLRWLELWNCRLITDEVVIRVAKLKQLRRLQFGFTPVTDKNLSELQALSNLEFLDLNHTLVTNAGLDAVAKLTTLQELELEDIKVTDDGIAKLESLKRLTRLKLSSISNISSKSISHLAKLPNLTTLYLRNCRFTDSSIDEFLKLKSLQFLQVDGNQITQQGIDRLGKHPTLRKVTVDSPLKFVRLTDLPVHDDIVKTLRQIGAKVEYGTGQEASKVKYIELAGESVNKNLTDSRVASLAAFGGSLETLRFNGNATDARLAVLDDLPNLQWLELFQCGEITDEAVIRAAKLKKLRKLQFGITRVSDKSLAALKALPNLELLDLNWTQVTDAGLPTIAALGSLKHLHLEGTKITDDGVAKLGSLTGLTMLNLSANSGVSDRGITSLAKLPNLATLYLRDCRIADSSLDSFRGLKKLQVLQLNGNPITQSGLNCLGNHPTLTQVYVDSPLKFVRSADVPKPAKNDPQLMGGDGWHGWPKEAPVPAIAPFDSEQAKKHQDEWAKY